MVHLVLCLVLTCQQIVVKRWCWAGVNCNGVFRDTNAGVISERWPHAWPIFRTFKLLAKQCDAMLWFFFSAFHEFSFSPFPWRAIKAFNLGHELWLDCTSAQVIKTPEICGYVCIWLTANPHGSLTGNQGIVKLLHWEWIALSKLG